MRECVRPDTGSMAAPWRRRGYPGGGRPVADVAVAQGPVPTLPLVAQDWCQLRSRCLVSRAVALSPPWSSQVWDKTNLMHGFQEPLAESGPILSPRAAIGRGLLVLGQPLTSWGGSGPGQLAVPPRPTALARAGAGLCTPGPPGSSLLSGTLLQAPQPPPHHSRWPEPDRGGPPHQTTAQLKPNTVNTRDPHQAEDQVRRSQQRAGQLAETRKPVLIRPAPLTCWPVAGDPIPGWPVVLLRASVAGKGSPRTPRPCGHLGPGPWRTRVSA